MTSQLLNESLQGVFKIKDSHAGSLLSHAGHHGDVPRLARGRRPPAGAADLPQAPGSGLAHPALRGAWRLSPQFVSRLAPCFLATGAGA